MAAIAIGGCGGGTATQDRGRADKSGGGERSIEEFGREATGPERAAIKGAFLSYLRAIAAHSFPAACSHLARGVRQSLKRVVAKGLKGVGCGTILSKLLVGSGAAARRQAEGDIAKIRVEGDRAFIVFHAPGAALYQLTMVREGHWKAATVTASVLVPSAAILRR